MALKILLPTGKTPVFEGSLYQWDYGRVLEIECEEIGSEIVEVHFACQGMHEAIVSLCTFSNSIGTVTIPNQCLEQAHAITVWIYKIEGTQGQTIKTFTLPITARTRPSKAYNVPTEYDDIYAQAVTKIDDAIGAIENGNVKAANAVKADSADYATTAGNAESASYATSAGSANTANAASVANALNYTKVHVGSVTVGEVIATDNFIKANTRYIIELSSGFYNGFSNSTGSFINFGGLDYDQYGSAQTTGLIEYDAEQGGIVFKGIRVICTRTDGTVEDYVAGGYTPRLIRIYECDTIGGISE